ncbi:MAG: dioxygenase [Pseudomonadota bacterium]|nr:dioxygenase [Pseudomonadota bacterium]
MLKQHFCSTPAKALQSREDVLAVMPLINQCEPFGNGLIATGLEEAGSEAINEMWTVKGKVTRGQTGRCYWSETDDVICVAHWLTKDECGDIEQHTQTAYGAILGVLNEKGFAHPFRFWNYLPAINAGDGDHEVYKKFCTGRLKAFEEAGISPQAFPAASALGHHNDGAVFYVFASRVKPRHYNNHHQVNAYEYPRQYGISSPSFARATALTLNDSHFLFISGTASITGHQTLGEGDIEKQLNVTMGNIRHLLDTANPEQCPLSAFKVYVRHEKDVAFIRDWLSSHYPDVETVYTLADICRKDLLVEIECFCV